MNYNPISLLKSLPYDLSFGPLLANAVQSPIPPIIATNFFQLTTSTKLSDSHTTRDSMWINNNIRS